MAEDVSLAGKSGGGGGVQACIAYFLVLSLVECDGSNCATDELVRACYERSSSHEQSRAKRPSFYKKSRDSSVPSVARSLVGGGPKCLPRSSSASTVTERQTSYLPPTSTPTSYSPPHQALAVLSFPSDPFHPESLTST